MTPEEKSLLLKDLSARLSYGTIVSVTDGTIKYDAYIESISHKYIQVSPVSGSVFTPYTFYKISEIRPYLRSMDSMMEEERKEYKYLVAFSGSPDGAANFVDWLNKNMFDYRGLIPMGLALEAPEGMYKID